MNLLFVCVLNSVSLHCRFDIYLFINKIHIFIFETVTKLETESRTHHMCDSKLSFKPQYTRFRGTIERRVTGFCLVFFFSLSQTMTFTYQKTTILFFENHKTLRHISFSHFAHKFHLDDGRRNDCSVFECCTQWSYSNKEMFL